MGKRGTRACIHDKINKIVKCKRSQEAIGMSFNMIFSILLIIAFVALAIYSIVYFLRIGRCTQIGSFVADLDDSVEQVWKISAPKTYIFKDHSLPSSIEYICFADFSKPATGKEEIYNTIIRYENSGTLFFYPPRKACDFPYYNLKHINVTAITSESNPYCIKNNGKPQLELSKDYYENLVKIK